MDGHHVGGKRPGREIGAHVPVWDIRRRFGDSVVVGGDDASALSAASSAYATWHRSFNHLYRLHGRQPVLGAWPETFPEMMKAQRAVAGSPRTVIEFMRRQVEASGINYIVAQLMFGDLPHETTRRSIELYAREVIPSIRR
jgi:alkanesulfonate monooxygenase SsuD/methylene tetrahydromethanopterin reductase-like flavin-dependent oxidoreductase (luciferase family)